jgi:methyl-accepting chemotaxis protein
MDDDNPVLRGFPAGQRTYVLRNKRKSYIIDRTFQYRLIGTFLVSIVFALVLFSGGTVLYYWASTMIGDNLFREFIDINKQVYTTVTNEEGELVRVPETRTVYGVKRWEIVVPPILINNLLIIVVVAVIGLFYSHRIVGPVYRINRDLQRVLDGEADVRVTLRGHDQFHALARRVNALLESFYDMKSKISDGD